jgi:type VI protein secretion system component VasK
MILKVLASILLVLGILGAFMGLMFRMDPGEERDAIAHDCIVGMFVASGSVLWLLARTLNSGGAHSGRSRLAFAVALSMLVFVPGLLFSWQWSILQERRHQAQRLRERRSREQDGAANRSQPVRSDTNQASAEAGPGRRPLRSTR